MKSRAKYPANNHHPAIVFTSFTLEAIDSASYLDHPSKTICPTPTSLANMPNSFTIKAPAGTDIWRKPPTTDVFNGMSTTPIPSSTNLPPPPPPRMINTQKQNKK